MKLKTLRGKEFCYFFGLLVFRNQKVPFFLGPLGWAGWGRARSLFSENLEEKVVS